VPGFTDAASGVPTFSSFFSSYFGGATYKATTPNCSKMLEGMKKCFENNQHNPHSACSYYTAGFKRMACAQ